MFGGADCTGNHTEEIMCSGDDCVLEYVGCFANMDINSWNWREEINETGNVPCIEHCLSLKYSLAGNGKYELSY